MYNVLEKTQSRKRIAVTPKKIYHVNQALLGTSGGQNRRIILWYCIFMCWCRRLSVACVKRGVCGEVLPHCLRKLLHLSANQMLVMLRPSSACVKELSTRRFWLEKSQWKTNHTGQNQNVGRRFNFLPRCSSQNVHPED